MKPNKVDLGKAFDRLKQDLFQAVEKTKGNSPARYAEAFGNLETSVKIHLIRCTDLTMEDLQKEMSSQDDIPSTLFNGQSEKDADYPLLNNE